MKRIALILIPVIMLAACSSAPDLRDEMIATFDVQMDTVAPDIDATDQTMIAENTGSVDSAEPTESLEQRFSSQSFLYVSGNYARNTVYEDTKYTEIFMLDKDNFLRIATSDLEEEVFAYNYISDDFTYLYYFDGELLAKVVYNVSSGQIKQDDSDLSEYIIIDAQELKIYCLEILKQAGISPEEL